MSRVLNSFRDLYRRKPHISHDYNTFIKIATIIANWSTIKPPNYQKIVSYSFYVINKKKKTSLQH